MHLYEINKKTPLFDLQAFNTFW